MPDGPPHGQTGRAGRERGRMPRLRQTQALVPPPRLPRAAPRPRIARNSTSTAGAEAGQAPQRGTAVNRRKLLKTLGLAGAGCCAGAIAAPGGPIAADSPAPSDSAADASAGNKRIMIAYVWSLDGSAGNIGDYSIAPGLLNLLQRHFPAYRMTAVEQRPPKSDRDIAIRNALQGFPDCDVIDNAFAGKAYRAALAGLESRSGGRLPSLADGNVDLVFDRFAADVADELKRSNPRAVELLQETALLIYNSGMILVYGEGTLARDDFWGYTVRRSMPLLVAWKLGVPYGIYAHSFDSFGGPPGLPYFQRLLEDARFVFCRDGSSVRYVRELGIDAPHLMFVPDSTLSFAGRDDPWAREFMARHGLEAKRFLVVIPRTWRGGGVISSAIGEQRSRMHLDKLRQIVRNWVQRTGMKVVIAAEVARDLPNARQFVYDPLPEETRKACVTLPSHWSTEQAASLYREARLLLTMEMHSFLMATAVGTPAVVATFQQSGRKISMVEDFQLGDWLLDVDAASTARIEQAVYAIHDNYPEQSARLERDVLPHLRRLERRAMEIIGGALAPA